MVLKSYSLSEDLSTFLLLLSDSTHVHLTCSKAKSISQSVLSLSLSHMYT